MRLGGRAMAFFISVDKKNARVKKRSYDNKREAS